MGTSESLNRRHAGAEYPDHAGGARSGQVESLGEKRANAMLRLEIPEFESLRLVSPARRAAVDRPGRKANGVLLPLISKPSHEHLRRSLTVRSAMDTKQNPLLATFSKRGWAQFDRLKAEFSFKAGETFELDDPERCGLYLLERGRVEIEHVWPQRRNRVRDIRTPGEHFGEYVVLDGLRRQTVRILEDSSGSWIPANRFGILVEKEPSLLLNLTRTVLRQQSDQDEQLISELTRTKAQAEQTLERLQAVTATSGAINSALDLDRLLEVILEEAQRLTRADRGTVYLVDRDAGQIHSYVCENGHLLKIALPLGKGFAGIAASRGVTINIEDAYQDPRFNPEVDQQTGYRTRSVLSMPIRNPRGEIIGVIQLLNKAGETRFTDEDEELIRTFGLHASVAIERTRIAEMMTRSRSLAAVGNFAASIIHDLKSPLTVIQGYVDLLNYAISAKDQKSHLEHISLQLNRMVGMTQEVLDYSRGRVRLNPVQVTVNKYFSELCDTMRPEMNQHDISLYFSSETDEAWTAIFDRDRFARVFHNLLSNSREAMPEGGNLTVSTTRNEKTWELRVQDTGVGIAPERLATIFEAFSTHGKVRGTGLGLTIAKTVIEEHGGEIHVESELSKGTSFTLSMPYRPKITSSEAQAPNPVNSFNNLRTLADNTSLEDKPASLN